MPILVGGGSRNHYNITLRGRGSAKYSDRSKNKTIHEGTKT